MFDEDGIFGDIPECAVRDRDIGVLSKDGIGSDLEEFNIIQGDIATVESESPDEGLDEPGIVSDLTFTENDCGIFGIEKDLTFGSKFVIIIEMQVRTGPRIDRNGCPGGIEPGVVGCVEPLDF